MEHHSHTDGHHHHHHIISSGQDSSNIAFAFWLNFSFCLLEFGGGVFTNSIAIMADALHDLGDSLALGLAWYFQRLSTKERDGYFSYGYGRFSLLGAFINATVLLVGALVVMREVFNRLLAPQDTYAEGMFVFAILGILVNGAAVIRLNKGTSLNSRVAALHLLEDVLGWFAVLVGSLVMYFTNWTIIDPILSLFINFFILFHVYKSLKSTFRVLLQGVPSHVDEAKVRERILAIDNVKDLHDLHLWTLDYEYHIMTVHLVVHEMVRISELKQEVRHILHHLHITHVTIEIETEAEPCVWVE
ncbi:MAG: cation transporter [Cytophagales bacterium]|nr:MAG: cation transporter [Cytophagales bacterium]